MSITLTNVEENVAVDADQDSTQDATGSETTLGAMDIGGALGGYDAAVSLSSEPDSPQPQIVEGRSPSRRAASKPGSPKHSTFQMIDLELHDIYDEHPFVDDVRQVSKPATPDSPATKVTLRELPVGTIPQAALITLAEHLPLHVIKKDDKHYCIGGLRFFRLLKHDLPASTQLHVLLQGGLSDQKIKSHIFFDLFAIPLFSAFNTTDRKTVRDLWGSKRGMELFNQAFGSNDSKQLAMILGCDPRTLKRSKVETPSS